MLLDRAWGKAPQHIGLTVDTKRVIDMTNQELEAIIAGALEQSGMKSGDLIEQAKLLAAPSPSGPLDVGKNVGTGEQLELEANKTNDLGSE